MPELESLAQKTAFMWTCPKCKEQIGDEFKSCGKCAGAVSAPTPSGKAKKPLEQFELICILVAAMPGILLFTGGGVRNPTQATFRIALFVIGVAGYVAIKLYQRRRMRGPK